MIVLPAIDLRGGRVVRLVEGDPARETTYGDDPVAVARRFAEAGAAWLHVVDLDAALGTGGSVNRDVIDSICRAVPLSVQTGGGLRSFDAISAVLDAGAARAVLGTAGTDPAFVREAAGRFGGERIVVALDVRTALDGGHAVMVKGWTEEGPDLDELLPALTEAGASRFLVTSIGADGTLEGPDLGLYRHVTGLTPVPVLASGGVGSPEDLDALATTGVEGVVVGKAFYEGRVPLETAAGERWR